MFARGLSSTKVFHTYMGVRLGGYVFAVHRMLPSLTSLVCTALAYFSSICRENARPVQRSHQKNTMRLFQSPSVRLFYLGVSNVYRLRARCTRSAVGLCSIACLFLVCVLCPLVVPPCRWFALPPLLASIFPVECCACRVPVSSRTAGDHVMR